MVRVSMLVNGEEVVAEVEPRTQLADFLRGDLHLTGTHLGCEQGVCGACTVMVDGKMQRSCITFASDCDGANITTIEGFDDDPTMSELREAFSEFHALQCGFCTPGMLTAARDTILRLGEISESRIREELSGNICRCTGYVGIVEAVKKVAAGKTPNAAASAAVTAKKFDHQKATAGAANTRRHVTPKPLADAAAPLSHQIEGGVSIEERIRVGATPEQVWAALSDLRRVVPCVPGAEITTLEGENLTGKVKIALGPIKASFSGQAVVGMDHAKREGWMTGKGRDSGLGSSAEGAARWKVVETDTGGADIVVILTWKLTGALAQFNRAGLVQDIVRRLAATFAANLEATITGSAPSAKPGAALGGFSLIWAVLKSKFSRKSKTTAK